MADRPHEKSAALHARLATVGITLDGQKPIAEATSRELGKKAEPPNPNAIRAILRARGAPERDLEWLVASCPSKDYARGYNPPPEWTLGFTARPVPKP